MSAVSLSKCHFGPFIIRGMHNRKKAVGATRTTKQRRLYHLIALSSGSGSLKQGEENRRLIAPAAVLLPPDHHAVVTCDAGASWGELVFQLVHAERDIGVGPGSWINKGPCQPSPIELFDVNLPLLVAAALVAEAITTVEMAGTTYFHSALHHAEANHLLGGWLLRYVRSLGRGGSATANDPWSRAECCARDRLETGCTVADMARAVGLSPTRFATVYTAARGQSPGAFLADLRLEVACRELASGRNVQGVAHMCGFRSPTSFAAFFKKRMGMTPTTWRRRTAC